MNVTKSWMLFFIVSVRAKNIPSFVSGHLMCDWYVIDTLIQGKKSRVLILSNVLDEEKLWSHNMSKKSRSNIVATDAKGMKHFWPRCEDQVSGKKKGIIFRSQDIWEIYLGIFPGNHSRSLFRALWTGATQAETILERNIFKIPFL